MNTELDPDFGEVPAYMAERLRAADARFREIQGDRNPFRDLPELATETIFGTDFFVYDARGRSVILPGVEGEQPVPFFALYANQGRFLTTCDLVSRRWVPELPALVRALERVERRQQGIAREPPDTNEANDDPEEITLDSFGLQVAVDCYILGYRDARSPLVVRKEWVIAVLALIATALSRIGLPEGSEVLGILRSPVFVFAPDNGGKMD